MIALPWWAMLLIRLGIAIGVPQLNKLVGPEVGAIVKDLLNHLANHPDPAKAVKEIKELHSCSGIGCFLGLKKD